MEPFGSIVQKHLPSICFPMGAFAVAVGKLATLPSTDCVDDNADVANCGKPADTYAAAKL